MLIFYISNGLFFGKQPRSARGRKGKKMGSKQGRKLDARLKKINEQLNQAGMPFPLTRVGNYKKGEIEICDVAHVFNLSDFIIVIIFKVRLPGSNELSDYIGFFNRTYCVEALSGQILIPVVNDQYFFMRYLSCPFVGRRLLEFPRGFIPLGNPDFCQVAGDIYSRKIQPAIQGLRFQISEFASLCGEDNQQLSLLENSLTCGNQVSVAWVQITIADNDIKLPRDFDLVKISEMNVLIRQGKISDMHTLSAWSLYQAVNK